MEGEFSLKISLRVFFPPCFLWHQSSGRLQWQQNFLEAKIPMHSVDGAALFFGLLLACCYHQMALLFPHIFE